MFQFLKFEDLKDDEIRLVEKSHDEIDLEKGKYAPRYGFSIIHIKDNQEIGVILFAVDTSRRQYLRGHLSYGVSSAYAGRNYAMKACKLVKKVALAHGFERLFIGAESDNIASIKTIKKLGACPITINDVPDENIIRTLLAQKINMFVWEIVEQDKGKIRNT